MRFNAWMVFAPLILRYSTRLPWRHLAYLARWFAVENPQRHQDQWRINAFFPPYPSAAFERFMQHAVARRRVPYSTYLAITDQCPYRCGHCSYAQRRSGRPTTLQALQLIEDIRQLGSCTIGLTGGEPLTRDDLPQLVEAIGSDTSSVVFTTGHGLTDARARELAQAGLGWMLIGIEAAHADEHDAVRQASGSFATARRAVQIALDAGIYTGISTVATRAKLNAGTLQRMTELAQQWQVHEFRILEPVPTGRYRGQCAEILSAAESKRLAEFHVAWNRAHRLPVISAFSHLESGRLFGCGAGYHHLFIDANGDVCPCDLTPLSFGNAFARPLAEIWRDMARWFARPRRQCLMHCLATHLPADSDVATLPLPLDASAAMMNHCPHDGELPDVFTHLLRH